MVLTTISAVRVPRRLPCRPVRPAHQPVHRHRLLSRSSGAVRLGLLLIPLGAWVERRRRAAGKPPSAVAVAAHRSQRSDAADDGGHRLRADDGQRRHRVAGGVSRRRVHGLGRVLRPGVPHGDEAGVRGARRTAARARQVRRVPCRLRAPASFAKAKLAGTRRVLAVSFSNYLAADRGRARPAAVRRATPANSVTGRSSSTATRSGASSDTPTTRRTPSR